MTRACVVNVSKSTENRSEQYLSHWADAVPSVSYRRNVNKHEFIDGKIHDTPTRTEFGRPSGGYHRRVRQCCQQDVGHPVHGNRRHTPTRCYPSAISLPFGYTARHVFACNANDRRGPYNNILHYTATRQSVYSDGNYCRVKFTAKTRGPSILTDYHRYRRHSPE